MTKFYAIETIQTMIEPEPRRSNLIVLCDWDEAVRAKRCGMQLRAPELASCDEETFDEQVRLPCSGVSVSLAHIKWGEWFKHSQELRQRAMPAALLCNKRQSNELIYSDMEELLAVSSGSLTAYSYIKCQRRYPFALTWSKHQVQMYSCAGVCERQRCVLVHSR